MKSQILKPKRELSEEESQYREAARLESWMKWSALLPWLIAITLGLFWLFNVGRGPFDSNRIGNVPQWVSAVAATAGVLRYISLSFKDKHRSIIQSLMRKATGSFEKDIERDNLNKLASAEMHKQAPLTYKVERQDDQVSVAVTLHNYSPYPLADTVGWIDTKGDWNVADLQEFRKTKTVAKNKALHMAALPGSTNLVTPNGVWSDFAKLEIPEDRWEAASLRMRWKVGATCFVAEVKLSSGVETRSVLGR